MKNDTEISKKPKKEENKISQKSKRSKSYEDEKLSISEKPTFKKIRSKSVQKADIPRVDSKLPNHQQYQVCKSVDGPHKYLSCFLMKTDLTFNNNKYYIV